MNREGQDSQSVSNTKNKKFLKRIGISIKSQSNRVNPTKRIKLERYLPNIHLPLLDEKQAYSHINSKQINEQTNQVASNPSISKSLPEEMFQYYDDKRKNFIENKFLPTCFENFPKPELKIANDEQIEELQSRQISKLQELLNKLLHNVYNLEYVSSGKYSYVFTGIRVPPEIEYDKNSVNKKIPCVVKISKGTISSLLCSKLQTDENNQINNQEKFSRNNDDKLKQENFFEKQQQGLEYLNKKFKTVEYLQEFQEIRFWYSYFISFTGIPNHLETIILEDTTTCVIMDKLALDLQGLSKVNSISDSMKSMFYDTTQKHIEINFLSLILQLIKILNFFHYSGLIGNQRKEPMIHCDIKGKNIMILEQDSKFQVKFIGLGFTIFERDIQNSAVSFSKGFVSQEIKRNFEISKLLSSSQFTYEELFRLKQEQLSLFPTKADDIWSIGVTIFQLFAQSIQPSNTSLFSFDWLHFYFIFYDIIKNRNFTDASLDKLNFQFLQYCTSTKLHNLFEDNLQNLFKNSDYKKYQRKSDSLIFKAGAEILNMIFSASREERNRPNFLNPIVDCLYKWNTQAQSEAQYLFIAISQEENPLNVIIHGGAKSGIYTNIAAFLYDMRIFFEDLSNIQDVEEFTFYTSLKKFLIEYEQNNQVQYFTKLDFLNILIFLIQYISSYGLWIKVSEKRQNLFIPAQTLYIANLYFLEFETNSETLHTSIFYIQPYSTILKRPIIDNLRKIESIFTLNQKQSLNNSS